MTVERRLGVLGGGALVFSSMVGTGIFTTSGLMIEKLGSASLVLWAWLLGGLIAGLGALAYGTLATALPNNGGEYQLLRRLYHPALGFVAGWVSLVAGFAAPVAASAAAFALYAGRVLPGVPPQLLSLSMLILVTAAHLRSVKLSARLQVVVAALQVVFMLALIAAGLLLGNPTHLTTAEPAMTSTVASGAFAHALIYVAFAYSGYNAAVYVAGEMRDPSRTLPLALVGATGLVVTIYLLVNVVYLTAAPLPELSGKVEIGFVAAHSLLGPTAATVVSLVICAGLVGCVSALTFAGPRVFEAMSQDTPQLGYFGRRSSDGPPLRATLLQNGLGAVILLTASFDAILTYIGLMLSCSALLALLGVFRLGRLRPPARASWLGRIAAAVAAALVCWIVVGTIWQAPGSALVSLLTLLVGVVGYSLLGRRVPAGAGATHQDEQAISTELRENAVPPGGSLGNG